MSGEPRFVPLDFRRLPADEMLARARAFRAELARRRSVRHFSAEPLPPGLLDECIAAAGSAPSGAHRQPWTFAVVTDPTLKRAIRLAAEEEERLNYSQRMGPEWLEALEPLGTSWEKPFLEIAPALVVVPSPMGFLQKILERPANERAYVLIPVGYAAQDCEVPNLSRKSLDEIRVQR
jgi:hypothetical protein